MTSTDLNSPKLNALDLNAPDLNSLDLNSPDLSTAAMLYSAESDCWNSIGIGGDFSCGELKQFIHCRNCPVYSAAGRSLLDRDSSSDYIADRTRILADETDQQETTIGSDTQSLVIFRLGDEWLALPANLFIEVTEPSVIHSLPHLSNNVLLGLINIRGEIQMCVSLKAMLQLDDYSTGSSNATSRLVVLEREGERWVFLVDELHGIRRVHSSEISNVPATVSKVPQTYTSALLNWDKARVSILDDELLFYTLNRQLL
jgi:chemotaxis-related protein WspD